MWSLENLAFSGSFLHKQLYSTGKKGTVAKSCILPRLSCKQKICCFCSGSRKHEIA